MTDAFNIKCHKCNGTGRFVSFSGRDCGDCFTCEGTGQIAPKARTHTDALPRSSTSRSLAIMSGVHCRDGLN